MAPTLELQLPGLRRLGLLGGSFDPVHSGHLHVARSACEAFDLEHLLFVPAARPPHKPGRVLANGDDRVAMLAIALGGEPTWSLTGIELEREGPSYTVDTLRGVGQRHGLDVGTELYFVIGWDNLHGLERWHEAEAVLALARPIVILRGEGDGAVLEHLRRELSPAAFARVEAGLLRLPPVDVSSTELREALARGEDPGPALPAGVLEYIRARGIYAAVPETPESLGGGPP